MSRPQPGVLLINKPTGLTSATPVRQIQAQLGAHPGKNWSVCHAGVLDPFASGLLPILIGPSTKLFEHIHALPKTYLATVRWGIATSTGDPGGTIVARHDASQLSPAVLEAALKTKIGWMPQVPPATSNKRIGKERAYALAHRGETVDLPAQQVYLHEAQWTHHDLPTSSGVRLICRGGFYVRSFVRELGEVLGCGAHVATLLRTQIGPWELPESEPTHVPGVQAFSWFPTVELGDDEWAVLKRGGHSVSLRRRARAARWSWPRDFPVPPELVFALHQQRGVALLERAGESWRPSMVLMPPV